MKINFLYTIAIVTIFSSTQIHAMLDPIIPLAVQQSFSQQSSAIKKYNNEQIPLKSITMKDFSSTTNNNAAILKNETYITISLNDNTNTYVHNNNTIQHIPEIETTTQEDYVTPVRGGEMLFAIGGCASVIGMIVYLSMLATGH